MPIVFVAVSILSLFASIPLSYLSLIAWRPKVIVLFPKRRGEEIIQQTGLRTLLVQAFLAVAEQELKESKQEEESKLIVGKKEELETSNCEFISI